MTSLLTMPYSLEYTRVSKFAAFIALNVLDFDKCQLYVVKWISNDLRLGKLDVFTREEVPVCLSTSALRNNNHLKLTVLKKINLPVEYQIFEMAEAL